jgi:hypothetical protein
LGRKPSSASSVSVSAAAAGAGQSTLNPRASQQPRGLLHQSLAAINSTLVNSAASLPGRDVDISPVRPPSSLSNASTARTTHKKRRAPPPPVVLVLRKEAKKSDRLVRCICPFFGLFVKIKDQIRATACF